jgi:hypothetical protein
MCAARSGNTGANDLQDCDWPTCGCENEKSEVAIALGLAIYARMVRLSQNCGQTVGEKNEYYVTLRQLEAAFVNMRDELRATR